MTQPYNSRPFRRDTEPKCRDAGPGAFACSLKPGHYGDHQALGMPDSEGRRKVHAEWPKSRRVA